MFSKFMAITSLGLLIELVAIGLVQSQSPCPDVFQYVRNPNTGLTDGRIQFRNVPKNVALRAKVHLSVAASLPSDNFGALELLDRDEALENIRQNRPLLYRLRLPIQQPLPLVTRILLNEQEHCTGRRASGSTVTSITLQHSLIPPGVDASLQDPVLHPVELPLYPEQGLPSFINPIPSSSPVTNLPSTTPFDWNSLVVEKDTSSKPVATDVPRGDFVEYNQCGQQMNAVSQFITNGEAIQPGEWPWVVALFVSTVKVQYQCSGTLISNKHVLTAAHCMKSSNGQDLPASTFIVSLGRYKIKRWNEKGSMNSEVLSYKVHHEYGKRGTYGNDLTVITLVRAVTFGELITPVCMWSGVQDVNNIVGQVGFVIGWGRDENGNPVTDEPMLSRVPIVSQEMCLRSNADFVAITSDRTLCAGARNGSGPCNGDSGAGLVMYDSKKHRFHLRGIVSLSLLNLATGSCDLSQFVVYTDIAKYSQWIQQQIVS